jgi:sortase A
MHNSFGKVIKATIIDLIVALLVTAILFTAIDVFLGQEINLLFGIANTISLDTENKKTIETVYSENKIENYPEYGTQYATIKIPRIDVDLPVYFGDTLEVLKKGVGHSSGSYFPGEGGSIIYMGHNSKKVFRRFSELKVGDKIYINATYGDFTYEIYDMQIVEETETDKLPIQKNEEKLMVYTCYPFNNIGYATQRYVVYANLVDE